MLQRWDVGKAFVEYEDKDGGKRRPVLIINVNSEQCITFKITKNLTRDDYLEYKIIKWQDAGLDCPSCVRLGHKVYFSDFDNVIKIGRLQKQDIDNIKILCQKFEIKLDEKLIQSSSNKALQQNIKTEIDSGKSPKQAAAIAYSIQRKNESMLDVTYGYEVYRVSDGELLATDGRLKSYEVAVKYAEETAQAYEEQGYGECSYDVFEDTNSTPVWNRKKTVYESKQLTESHDFQEDKGFELDLDTDLTDQELEEQLSSEVVFSKGYIDKYSHLFSDFDTLIKKLYKYLNIENNDKLKSEIRQHKDTLKIGVHVLDLISDDGEAKTYKDQQIAIDKLKAIIESLGYNVLRTRWAQSGSKSFGQIAPYVIFYIDFKKDSSNNQKLEEDMEDFNIYLILTDYSVEQYGYYNANDFYDYLDELKQKTDDELFDDEILAYVGMNSNEEIIEYYISNKADINKVKNIIDNGFETKNLDEGYSKQGYSWDEVNGMIHIYENGKLIDKYPDMESAEEAGWDLEMLVEDLDEECYNINEENEATSLTFIETPEFKNSWKDLGLNDEDLRQLQLIIMKDKSQWIDLGSGAYKIYFKPTNTNRSKNNSNRVFYIHWIKADKIYFIYAIHKNAEANIDKKSQNALIKLAKEINK